jgi:hypothetical protein
VKNDVKLFRVTGTTCSQVQLAASEISVVKGDVTVTITSAAAPPPGSYWVISVKYSTSTVTGKLVPTTSNRRVTYSFTTNVGGSAKETDIKGLALAPKFTVPASCPITPPVPAAAARIACRQKGGKCAKKSDCCGALKCHNGRCKKRL